FRSDIPPGVRFGTVSRDSEALAIRTRRDSHMSRKHTTQLFFAVEAAAPCNVVDSVVRLFEGPACRLDANAFNGTGRCALACVGIAAGEIAGTHPDPLRQMLHA